MTSTRNAVADAATTTDCADLVNDSKTASMRLRASSEAHEKPATPSRSPTTRTKAGHTVSPKAPASSDASDALPEPPRQTKASAVAALLTRDGGASLEVLCEATGWQPHTCRAFLTGLRKKGREVIRASDKDGKSIYLMASDRSAVSSHEDEQTVADSV